MASPMCSTNSATTPKDHHQGDLYPSSRIESSGLRTFFWQTEVVAHKDPATYRRLLDLGVDPSNFVMVGNSLPSDVLPVMEIGGKAVHVYHVTWAHEHHDGDHEAPTIEHLGELLRSSRTGDSAERQRVAMICGASRPPRNAAPMLRTSRQSRDP